MLSDYYLLSDLTYSHFTSASHTHTHARNHTHPTQYYSDYLARQTCAPPCSIQSLFSLPPLFSPSVQGLDITFMLYCLWVLNENVLPISNPKHAKQVFQTLVRSIINSIFASITWPCCVWVAGELLTYWHSDNDSSVWAVELLPCLFLCLSPSLLRSLCLSLCVSFLSFTLPVCSFLHKTSSLSVFFFSLSCFFHVCLCFSCGHPLSLSFSGFLLCLAFFPLLSKAPHDVKCLMAGWGVWPLCFPLTQKAH